MKTFIVSYGDSTQYRTDDPSQVKEFSAQLKSELADKFPGQTFTAFTEPEIKEVDLAGHPEYRTYPCFDASSKDKIYKTLIRGIKVRAEVKELNDGSPWDAIDN